MGAVKQTTIHGKSSRRMEKSGSLETTKGMKAAEQEARALAYGTESDGRSEDPPFNSNRAVHSLSNGKRR